MDFGLDGPEEEFKVKEIGDLEGEGYRAPEMTEMTKKFIPMTIYFTNTTLHSEHRSAKVENHDDMEKLTETMKDVKIEQQK